MHLERDDTITVTPDCIKSSTITYLSGIIEALAL
jgi:hypothetical protein